MTRRLRAKFWAWAWNGVDVCACPCEYCSQCWRDDPRKGCQR